jgi:hypothetical protein
MIVLNGKPYLGVTTVFTPTNPPRHLVTYRIDGEASAPLYLEHGASDTDLARYLKASEVGQISHLRFWKYDDHESTIQGSILEQFT